MDHTDLQSWATADSDNLQSLWVNGKCTAGNCLPKASVALTVISCVAAIVGSLLIICTFLCWKDLRTIARMILVFLAVADLLSALGYLFGAAVYIQYFYTQGYCNSDNETWSVNHTALNLTAYHDLCIAQSFFTTVMPMASFFWTGNLAVYLFFSLAWQKVRYTKTLMAIFHTIAWGIPLVTCIAIVSDGRFGPSSSRSSGGWCWIKFENETDFEHPTVYLISELMAGKFWEISVCIVALLAYVGVKIMGWKRFSQPKKVTKDTPYSSNSVEKKLQAAYTKVDQKLIWLPIVFLLLRMWGNIRFFVSIHCSGANSPHCCNLVYNRFLLYMQSICDPGQGWSNALLFVIFNHKILHRLCPCLESVENWCCTRIGRIFPKRQRRRESVRVPRRARVVASEYPGKTSEEATQRGGGGGRGDREPLLDSLRSNISSSVLYSNAILPSGSHESSASVQQGISTRPKNPSINSKV